jgi:hypothetical protein
MSKDFRVSTTFLTHPKTIKLRSKFGSKGVERLLSLWAFASEYRPKGVLKGMTDADIEIAVGWKGRRGAFVGILLELGWLDNGDGVRSIHNWQKHNGFAFFSDERSERAKKAIAVRWAKHEDAPGKEQSEDGGGELPESAGPYLAQLDQEEVKLLREFISLAVEAQNGKGLSESEKVGLIDEILKLKTKYPDKFKTAFQETVDRKIFRPGYVEAIIHNTDDGKKGGLWAKDARFKREEQAAREKHSRAAEKTQEMLRKLRAAGDDGGDGNGFQGIGTARTLLPDEEEANGAEAEKQNPQVPLTNKEESVKDLSIQSELHKETDTVSITGGNTECNTECNTPSPSPLPPPIPRPLPPPPPPPSPSPAPKAPAVDGFVSYWNGKDTLPKIVEMSPEREQLFTALCQRASFRSNWRQIIDKAADCRLTKPEKHQSGGRWVQWPGITVDWLLSKDKQGLDNFLKVLEGKYSDSEDDDSW